MDTPDKIVALCVTDHETGRDLFIKTGPHLQLHAEAMEMVKNGRDAWTRPTSTTPEMKQPAPTADGYWWTRPDSGCMWRVVEITIIKGAIYVEEMGEDGQDLLPACPWWQWAGPIAPPPLA